ncbi:DUF4376 domain-containing protein [Kingella kingae]|uniref:DUF4376 domain-containing protein n=2 Tax=Kingella kingae TaxID=504 RepID=UPI001E46298A|nr:DUF4376 domain-containing protein [Kingella kingae]
MQKSQKTPWLTSYLNLAYRIIKCIECRLLDTRRFNLAAIVPKQPARLGQHKQTWQINAQRQAEQHAQNQATAWDNIKQMRYHNTHSGVFVPSVGKWFHTDDASRIQYVALQTMPQMPSSLQWKTMDNHFVPMNKALLSEILGAMMLHETADFANAEQHRAAMLASDNPLDYDFSGGWQEIYKESV